MKKNLSKRNPGMVGPIVSPLEAARGLETLAYSYEERARRASEMAETTTARWLAFQDFNLALGRLAPTVRKLALQIRTGTPVETAFTELLGLVKDLSYVTGTGATIRAYDEVFVYYQASVSGFEPDGKWAIRSKVRAGDQPFKERVFHRY